MIGTSSNKLKMILFKNYSDYTQCKLIVLVSDLKKFENSQPSALKFFLVTRTIFSHHRSEQFLKQNTIFLHSIALSGFTLHNPNVLQIALLKLKKKILIPFRA